MARSYQNYSPVAAPTTPGSTGSSRIDFKRLVDIPALQELTDELYRATSIPSAVITMDGEVLSGSGWQRICTDFHRRHPDLEKECIAADVAIRKRLDDGEPFVIYRCPRGLIDASSPVIIEGQHVANVFAGQLFTEPPDAAMEASFREQARRFGLDEKAYLEAFREVPVFPESRFRPALSFLARFARLLASIGLARLRELDAMEELRSSERRYRQLVESTAAVPWELDAASQRFTYMGPQAERVLGFPAEHWKDFQSWADAILEEDRATATSFCRARTEAGEDHEFDYRIKDPTGRIRWIRDVVSVVGGAGGPERLVGFMRDVTDLKQAESEKEALHERLDQARKLEAVGTLAGGVAHDMNNILGILVGYSELLCAELPEGSPLRDYALETLRGSKRAAAIIEDLLTLARRRVPTSETIDVNAMIRELAESPETSALRARHPDVRLIVELDPRLLRVYGSRVHLRKSIASLVSNAFEAIDAAGVVSVHTENRYLEPREAALEDLAEGEYVKLTVVDTGRGIPEKDRSRIFEPFYTRKVMGLSGTGLGLALVWGTVQDLKGRVTVASSEGAGSTFTLNLPASREEASPEAGLVAREEYLGRGEHLLVVDDVPEQRDLAARILTGLGYRVETEASGEAAVERLASGGVDLVVLDMIMEPGMDGLDTWRAMASIHPGLSLVVVSGFAETERVRELQRLSACPYVRKPYLAEMLGLAVRRALDRPR